jgi:integrase
MLENDLRTMSPAKLAALSKYYGLRQQGAKGTWVIRKSVTDSRTHLERTFKRSTKTADLRLALHRASEWVDEFVADVHGNRMPALAGTAKWASLQQIGEHYLQAATCKITVRRMNWNHLAQIVEEFYPEANVPQLGYNWQSREVKYAFTSKEGAAPLSSELLDGRLVRQWQLMRRVAAEKQYLPKKVGECERAKRTINAVYRKARSVFSAAMLRSYEDHGLRLPPGVKEFPKQGFLSAAQPPPAEQLSPEVVEKVMELMPQLRKVDPATWAAMILMYRGGLRNIEAEKARWSWVMPAIGGGSVLRLYSDLDYGVKAKERIVSLSPEVVKLLTEVRRKGDDYLVPAENENQRRIACYRGVNKFLRECGVVKRRGKVAYRLRGHAITEVMLANGMDAAKEFAGHTTVKTTQIYKGAAVPYKALGMPGA